MQKNMVMKSVEKHFTHNEIKWFLDVIVIVPTNPSPTIFGSMSLNQCSKAKNIPLHGKSYALWLCMKVRKRTYKVKSRIRVFVFVSMQCLKNRCSYGKPHSTLSCHGTMLKATLNYVQTNEQVLGSNCHTRLQLSSDIIRIFSSKQTWTAKTKDLFFRPPEFYWLLLNMRVGKKSC